MRQSTYGCNSLKAIACTTAQNDHGARDYKQRKKGAAAALEQRHGIEEFPAHYLLQRLGCKSNHDSKRVALHLKMKYCHEQRILETPQVNQAHTVHVNEHPCIHSTVVLRLCTSVNNRICDICMGKTATCILSSITNMKSRV